MIITNWQTIISDKRIKQGGGIYIMYDGCGNCLYIGKSSEVNYRLLAHWGLVNSWSGQSLVGGFIERHSPDSAHWPIVILESQDYEQQDFKETELIRSLMPPFNATNKTGKSMLNSLYADSRPGESSSLYLNAL